MSYAATARAVREEILPGEVPLWRHPGWRDRFPWLVQGITGAGDDGEPFDLGLFGGQPVGEAMRRWRMLMSAAGFSRAVHARQVHGGDLQVHPDGGGEGLLIMEGVDGHLTRRPDLLLSVSVADCVPLFMVDGSRRTLALVHAGWRGVAAGIAENAVQALLDGGSRAGDLYAHSGPSICGDCYEVGPEVHRGVNPQGETPEHPATIDLRQALSARLERCGVPPSNITRSAHCTLCGPGRFFSHRGGSPARQMGVLGRLE